MIKNKGLCSITQEELNSILEQNEEYFNHDCEEDPDGRPSFIYDLEYLVFKNIDFNNKDFYSMYFDHSIFSIKNIKDSKFRDTSFNYSNLFDTCFTKCRLGKATFEQAFCQETEFHLCDLREVDFSRSNLTSAVFIDCKLNQANFTGAKITNALFKNCDLTDADFSYTHSYGTMFIECKGKTE